jgi:transposase
MAARASVVEEDVLMATAVAESRNQLGQIATRNKKLACMPRRKY